MYKKASKLKLRIPSKFGNISVEQLWDLKLSDLATIIKELHEEKKKFNTVEDLAFLDGANESKESILTNLRYEIVKDVYLTKQNESKEAKELRNKKAEVNRLEEILMRKKEAELENLSVEELEKKIAELSK